MLATTTGKGEILSQNTLFLTPGDSDQILKNINYHNKKIVMNKLIQKISKTKSFLVSLVLVFLWVAPFTFLFKRDFGEKFYIFFTYFLVLLTILFFLVFVFVFLKNKKYKHLLIFILGFVFASYLTFFVAMPVVMFSSISKSHRDGNIPDKENFSTYLIRDLSKYFSDKNKLKTSVLYY